MTKLTATQIPTTAQANALVRAACARVVREAQAKGDPGVALVIARIAARRSA